MSIISKPEKIMGGKRLIVLEEKPSSEVYLKTVLCLWGNEYVTWWYNTEMDSYSCGHYHKNIIDAVEDYKNRR